jgi:hypothetical protein
LLQLLLRIWLVKSIAATADLVLVMCSLISVDGAWGGGLAGRKEVCCLLVL